MTLHNLMAERDAAYRAMILADDTWFDAILQTYGERNASTFRYTSKGIATDRLASLHQAYRDSRDAYLAAQDAYLKMRDWGQA